MEKEKLLEALFGKELRRYEMAKMSDELCPKCGGRMWDNSVGKKPSKNYPDRKCSECGHGIWLTKKEKEETKNNPPPAQEKTGGSDVSNYGNSVPPSMYGAWSVNCLIAFINGGKYKTVDEALKDLPKIFRKIGTTVNSQASASIPAGTPASSLAKTTAKPAETKASETPEGGLDLGDLEEDTFDDLDI